MYHDGWLVHSSDGLVLHPSDDGIGEWFVRNSTTIEYVESEKEKGRDMKITPIIYKNDDDKRDM